MNHEQLEGYKMCLKEFDQYLASSIKRNGGMVTPGQAWDVMNDVAYFTHQQALRIHRAQNASSVQVIYVAGGIH